ncbi:hypothetical protein LCGC14_2544770, partial [marine sediment metagenome]
RTLPAEGGRRHWLTCEFSRIKSWSDHSGLHRSLYDTPPPRQPQQSEPSSVDSTASVISRGPTIHPVRIASSTTCFASSNFCRATNRFPRPISSFLICSMLESRSSGDCFNISATSSSRSA